MTGRPRSVGAKTHRRAPGPTSSELRRAASSNLTTANALCRPSVAGRQVRRSGEGAAVVPGRERRGGLLRAARGRADGTSVGQPDGPGTGPDQPVHRRVRRDGHRGAAVVPGVRPAPLTVGVRRRRRAVHGGHGAGAAAGRPGGRPGAPAQAGRRRRVRAVHRRTPGDGARRAGVGRSRRPGAGGPPGQGDPDVTARRDDLHGDAAGAVGCGVRRAPRAGHGRSDDGAGARLRGAGRRARRVRRGVRGQLVRRPDRPRRRRPVRAAAGPAGPARGRPGRLAPRRRPPGPDARTAGRARGSDRAQPDHAR